jgi:EpsI family protein
MQFNFLRSRTALVLSVFLAVQCAVFYGYSRGEIPAAAKSLETFPADLGKWHMIQQGVMEPEIKDVLRADDYVTRDYAASATQVANLFVAFFKTQRAGQTPHSPKNCLPGSGWVWTVSDTIPVAVPGRETPIEINRYVIAKGEDKAVVLYWYQSRDRVVAREYQAAAYVAWDALRYNRTDTSIVKVTVRIVNNQEDAATQTGVDFIQSFFATLRQYFPA